MRIGQYGIIFFNGEQRIGEIQHIGEKTAVLEFYGRASQGRYKVSHPKDSILLVNQTHYIKENSVCMLRSSDTPQRRISGCIVEEISTNSVTGEEEYSIISRRDSEVGYELYRSKVLLDALSSVDTDTAQNVASRFLSADCPQSLKSKILHRDCIQCGSSVSTLGSEWNQFLSGDEIPEENCICNECKRLESNTFCCEMCDQIKPFWKNCRMLHSRRACEVSSNYDYICHTCARGVPLCENCGTVSRVDSLIVDERRLCPVCSEQTVQLIYQHPARTVYPEIFSQSGEFSKTKSKRHAGIEIECIHDWGRLDVPMGWRIVSDTSISDEEYGAEYVMSRPLNGDKLLNKIERITSFINSTGGFVDESCGLHIHINGLDMKLREMKNCLAIGKSMETWIYDMFPPSRKKSRYSKPLPDFDVKELMGISTYSEFVKFWYHTISDTEISTGKYNNSRYRGFNVHSRFINGTIEFRHHHGTLNLISIEQWLKLCMAVVDTSFEMSKDSKEILIDSPLEYSASDFFYAIGLSEFNNHYNIMKEKVKTVKPKESPRTTPFLDPDPFLDDEFHYDEDRHNLGMIEERDSDLERM